VIALHPARLKDLRDMAALEHAAFPAPWRWYHLLAGFYPGGKIVVAEVDGRFAGFVLCLGKRLARLAVAPEYRRQGVGRALVEAVRRPGMTLQVRESNSSARALYAGLGLRKVGECQYIDGEKGEIWLWQGEMGNCVHIKASNCMNSSVKPSPKTDYMQK
jgi:ribosomal protein S18 acetylase RimI-like enzyme